MSQCPQGHPTPLGAIFCPTCGASVALVVQIEDDPGDRSPAPQIPPPVSPHPDGQEPARPRRGAATGGRRRPVVLAATILSLVLIGIAVVVVLHQSDDSGSDSPSAANTRTADSPAAAEFEGVSSGTELSGLLSPTLSLCEEQSPTAPYIAEASCHGDDGADNYIYVYESPEARIEHIASEFEQAGIDYDCGTGIGDAPTSHSEVGYNIEFDNWEVAQVSLEQVQEIAASVPDLKICAHP